MRSRSVGIVSGVVVVLLFTIRSQLKMKKVLFRPSYTRGRYTGPDREAPNSCRRDIPRGTFKRLLFQLLAFSASLRRNSYALPWTLLVPVLPAARRTPPTERPYSAEKLFVMKRTSSTTSIGGV